MRTIFLLLTLIVAAFGGASPAKPNIIFILADDLGYGEPGCYGQKNIKTPNIDKLAGEGMRFTQVYSGSTVCAPSRCTLMTGYHTGHARIRGNNGVPLKPTDLTIAEILKKQGYRTALVGKWGLGEAATSGTPTQKGFDEFFGYLNQTHAHDHYPQFMWRNNEKVQFGGKYYADDLFTSAAVDFVKRSGKEPFFLYLSYTIPHMKMQVPSYDQYTSNTWPVAEQKKAAMISFMDDGIGQVMAQLKRQGIDDNTIVFFTSDNGPHHEDGADPKFFNSSGDLRGYKRDLYEGGIRVPMIVRWNGHVKPATTNDAQWAFWDFLPTACELVGAKTPAGIDGVSVVPTLTQGQPLKQRDLYWEFYERGFQQAVRMGNWKALRLKQAGPIELYDLSSDRTETINVASKHPDVVAQAEKAMNSQHIDDSNWPVDGSLPVKKKKTNAAAKKTTGTAVSSSIE